MGKIYTTKVTRFDGGVTTVLRNAQLNKARLIQHFDNFTKKNVLIPYRNVESLDDGVLTQANTHLQNFLIYGSKLFAIGKQTGNSRAVLYENNSPNVGAGSWAVSTGTLPSAQNTDGILTSDNSYQFFAEYKDVIYYLNAQGLGSYTIGTTTYNETANPISGITSICQGIKHSKDSIFYFGYTTTTATYIGRKNGASAFENTALTIPTTDYKVVDLFEYGNYLGIALAPLKNGLNSLILLWDRDSSVSTISEAIDWGNNVLYAADSIDGYLIGISLQTNVGNTSVFLYPKLVIKKYGGGGAVLVDELPLTSAVTILGKRKYNNRIYFGLSATSLIDSQNSGTTNDLSGIWSVGRSGENEPFSLNFDRVASNTTQINFHDGTRPCGGFIVIGDFVYISHLVGSTYTLTKTNYQNSFSANSIYQSPYFATVDSATVKKLIGVTLTYEKIPASGSISLYYRKDGATSWTLIFTDSTANSTSHDAINIESTAETFDQYSEVEFQIISTGVAPTGLFFAEEVIDNALYG